MKRMLIAMLLVSQIGSGCVLFGQRLLEEEWEPADAQFAACITIPLERPSQSCQPAVPHEDDAVFFDSSLAVVQNSDLGEPEEGIGACALR